MRFLFFQRRVLGRPQLSLLFATSLLLLCLAIVPPRPEDPFGLNMYLYGLMRALNLAYSGQSIILMVISYAITFFALGYLFILHSAVLSCGERLDVKSFHFTSAQLTCYDASYLETMKKILAAHPSVDKSDAIISVSNKIARKVGWNGSVTDKEAEVFLRDYYNAMREHLEREKIDEVLLEFDITPQKDLQRFPLSSAPSEKTQLGTTQKLPENEHRVAQTARQGQKREESVISPRYFFTQNQLARFSDGDLPRLRELIRQELTLKTAQAFATECDRICQIIDRKNGVSIDWSESVPGKRCHQFLTDFYNAKSKSIAER